MRHFPMFADLRGRRVLVAGGGEIAERKVRLLLEAGAEVTVVAPQFNAWLASHAELRRLEQRFDASLLTGHVLAIAATDDPTVNAEVAAAAAGRGLFVNVVDDAQTSSFIVPAIVDRSPLTVAISSGGTAPVLSRLVREKIETLLDESWGELASLFERWRERIRARLPEVAARRRIYERAVRGEVADLVRVGRVSDAEQALERLLVECDDAAPGMVVFVGAGPGDPGLLTLDALRALQEAEVIVHGPDASEAVLRLARRDATRVAVDVPGDESLSLVRAGRRVVRLVVGDPLDSAACRAEVELLREQGVRVDVVRGVPVSRP